MSIDVSSLLSDYDKAQSALPSIEVTGRPLEAQIDPGHLLMVDENAIAEKDLNNEKKRQKTLDNLARDNAQLLFNTLFKLPVVKVDDILCVELPAPETKIPREKPLPKPKELTKWEKFAKEKGIVKKKKTRVVWDDAVREWVPRYGYKKIQAEEEKNWIMPYKGDRPDEDPREKEIEKKRESMAKNELQRLRNIARQKKVKLPSVGIAPLVDKQTKVTDSSELKKAADLAHVSTASLGKFQGKLTGAMEKAAAKAGGKGGSGKKRQFDPLVSEGEREKSLKLLEKMNSKKPKIDLNQAVNRAIHEEEAERSKQKAAEGGKGKKGRKGGKGPGGKGRFSKKGGHQSGGKAGSAGGKRRGAKGKK